MAEKPHADVQEVVRALLLAELEVDGEPADPRRVGPYPGVKTVYDPYYISIEADTGSADYFGQRTPVDIDVFAPRVATAKTIAFAINLILLRYPWSVRVDADRNYVIDEVTDAGTPTSMPWDDNSVRRLGASYTISLRR